MNGTVYSLIVVVTTMIMSPGTDRIGTKPHPASSPPTRPVVQWLLNPQDANDAIQATQIFFNAMHDEDWTTVAKFWPKDSGINQQFDDVFTGKLKDMMAGVDIASIGSPYKESGNDWTMVPYEVQFKDGSSQTNNLRLQKQPDGQWICGGGF